MKYYQVTEGEWMRPVHRGHKLCCCDCGLVHTMDFRVVNGQVEYAHSGRTGLQPMFEGT